jgi:membrane protease YdiL (CAAX protease family)
VYGRMSAASSVGDAMNGKRVARDAVLVMLLTGVGGFVVGFVAAANGGETSTTALAVSSFGLSIVGFAVSGSLTRRDRVRHLLTVAALVWVLSLVNLPFGVSVERWLASSVAILIACAVGGGISALMFRPEPEVHAGEHPAVEPSAMDPTLSGATPAGVDPVNAQRALRVFVLYLGVQLVAGLLAGLIVGAAFALRGGDPSDAASIEALTKQIEGPASLAGLAAGGIAVAWSELRRRRRLDPELRRAIGWSPAALRSLVVAAAAGASVALVYLALAATVWPPSSEFTPGPMTQMALSSGWLLQAWRFAVLAISPPVEEFLFRGVLLAGLASSWGSKAAAAVTTVLFVSVHYFEIAAYLPAVLGLTGMSVVALYFRARTDSLAPPVAVHFGYNLLLVCANAVATLGSSPA